MNRPRYAHATQRSFYRLDPALSEQVERVPYPAAPEPIPRAEVRELWLPTQADELEAEYAAA